MALNYSPYVFSISTLFKTSSFVLTFSSCRNANSISGRFDLVRLRRLGDADDLPRRVVLGRCGLRSVADIL